MGNKKKPVLSPLDKAWAKVEEALMEFASSRDQEWSEWAYNKIAEEYDRVIDLSYQIESYRG